MLKQILNLQFNDFFNTFLGNISLYARTVTTMREEKGGTCMDAKTTKYYLYNESFLVHDEGSANPCLSHVTQTVCVELYASAIYSVKLTNSYTSLNFAKRNTLTFICTLVMKIMWKFSRKV